MARPDINDGHIDIAHDLANALMKINLSGYQYRIIWCIFRKTYGWHKSTDKISLTGFEKMTGLKRRDIYRTLKDLEKMNMIIIDRNTYINIYKFNANYDTWKVKTSSKIATSSKLATHKRNYKRNHSKESEKGFSNNANIGEEETLAIFFAVSENMYNLDLQFDVISINLSGTCFLDNIKNIREICNNMKASEIKENFNLNHIQNAF